MNNFHQKVTGGRLFWNGGSNTCVGFVINKLNLKLTIILITCKAIAI